MLQNNQCCGFTQCAWIIVYAIEKYDSTYINVEGMPFEGAVQFSACFRITMIFDIAAVYSMLEFVS